MMISRLKGYGPTLAACVAAAAAKLWLVGAQTLSAVAPAPADDELFLRQAESILRGDWLGPLDEYTLAKGPVYPLWLAAVHATGTPLLLAQQVFFLSAAALLVIAVGPVLRARWARATLFCALAFDPASFADGPATRVIRDGFYSSLTLVLFASTIGLAVRLSDGLRRTAPWALATGLSAALLAMTREEGIWVLPSLAVILAAGIAASWRARGRAWLLSAALSLSAYLAPTAAIASANAARYGLYTTCEVTSDYFKAAIGALTRVRGERWHPYVAVPRDARQAIFDVSPAFREIAPYLEARSRGWITHGCNTIGVCDDMAAGWFMWAVRDAVGATGKYREGAAAARSWYSRLAEEIDEACASRRLSCGPSRRSLASPWNPAYVRPFLASLAAGTWRLLTRDGIAATPSPAFVSDADRVRYERVTNEKIWPTRVRVAGIIQADHAIPRVAITNAAVKPQAATIQVRALQADPSSAKGRARIEVDTTCGGGCLIWLISGDEPLLSVPLGPGETRSMDAVTWRTVEFALEPAALPALAPLRFRILDALTMLWGWLVPVLMPLAVSLGAWRMIRAVRTGSAMDALAPALAFALLGGALVRLILLAAIDVSAFRAIAVLYAAPGYALVTTGVALVLLCELPPLLVRQTPLGRSCAER